MNEYQDRDILTDRAESQRLRVVLRLPKQTCLFSMTNRLAWPYWEKTELLESLVAAGDYRKVEVFDRVHHSPDVRQAASAKYQRFKAPFSDLNRLMTPRGRARCFHELRETDTKLTRAVFDRALREWLAGGRVPMAFAPRWPDRGPQAVVSKDLDDVPYATALKHVRERATQIDIGSHPLPEKPPTHTKDGRPRRRLAPQKPTLYRTDRETLRVFLHFYRWKLEKPGRSLRQAYDEMSVRVFVDQDAAGNTYDLDQRQIPSYATFEQFYFVLMPLSQRRIGTKGKKHFDLNERPVTGEESSRSVASGLVASGDATIWNVGIRSRFPGRRPVGPPVVFRIRAKKGGMLIGLAISLENASFMGMATAIVCCVTNKVAFCAAAGIEISADEWPCEGLPAVIEFDRGETDNDKPTEFVDLTGVDVVNLKKGRPDLKPGVESDFRTLQVQLNGMTPGMLIETWEKATNQKWVLAGEMDIDQFTRLVIGHELNRMKQIREGIDLDDEMIAAGVVRSSLSIWKYELERKGGLMTFDRETVAISLLPIEAASTTPAGLYFKGCYYTSQELVARHEFARARIHGGSKAKVKSDHRLVDTVYLVELGGKRVNPPMLCRLSMDLKHQHNYLGKTFREVAELQEHDAHNHGIGLTIARASALQTQRVHNEINQQAAAATAAQADPTVSANALLEGIPAARIAEDNVHAPTQALVPSMRQLDAGQSAQVVSLVKAPTDNQPPKPPAPVQGTNTPAKPKGPGGRVSYLDLLNNATTSQGSTP